jgi:DNA-binding NarL/FixJ family response regulator
VKDLSPQQLECVKAICLGFSSKEVAARLGIKTRTVDEYMCRAMAKLRINSRVKLVHYALARGYIENIYAQEPNG